MGKMFEVSVIRRRYMTEGEFGRQTFDADEVLIGVDGEGRQWVRTEKRLARSTVTGGSLCYSGWKSITGIPLQPNKVYRLTISASMVGEAKRVVDLTANEDLPPVEEVIEQENQDMKGAREYDAALKKAKMDKRKDEA